MKQSVRCAAVAAQGRQQRCHCNSWIAAAACTLQRKRCVAVTWHSSAAVFLQKSFDDLRHRIFAANDGELQYAEITMLTRSPSP
jgi:hypothetical protein